jgi:hypothetical protein
VGKLEKFHENHSMFFQMIRSIKKSSNFMCYLNNTIGNIHKLFNVVVQYPPNFIVDSMEKTENQAVKLHHGLNLNCKVDGNPEPKVSWIFVSFHG